MRGFTSDERLALMSGIADDATGFQLVERGLVTLGRVERVFGLALFQHAHATELGHIAARLVRSGLV